VLEADPRGLAWAPGLRYLTEDEPPIALSFRERPEDFVVDELPSFEPSGGGEHRLLRIEKRGISTFDLVAHVARVLEISKKHIGYAGLKDARGVTRQWISVPAQSESRLGEIERDGVRMLEVASNDRKLRLGALAGNRFDLRLGGISEADRARTEASLELLSRRGLPNYFGPQRFGLHGRGHELGRVLLEDRPREFLLLWTGSQHAPSTPELEELHGAIARGQSSELRKLGGLATRLPRDYATLARQLARRRGDFRSALRALPRPMLRLHLSALQSRAFNRVLATRLESYDRPGPGDLVQLHPGRSLFEVGPEEDLEELRRRAVRAELSPTGPLFGARTPTPSGVWRTLEERARAEESLEAERWRNLPAGLEMPGQRRSLRAPLEGLKHRWDGKFLRVEFSLPPGSYASVLVAELSKNP
jgi:tRNA pseudouridine13 synthase